MLHTDGPVFTARLATETTDFSRVHERVFNPMLPQDRNGAVGRESLRDSVQRDGSHRRPQPNAIDSDFDAAPIDRPPRGGDLCLRWQLTALAR